MALLGAASVANVSDSFDRADSTSSLGTADSGHAWTAVTDTWGIATNQAYDSAPAGSYGLATVASGRSDGTIQVTLATAVGAGFPGITFRLVDANNAWWVICDATTLYIQKREAGANSTPASGAITLANGGIVRVVLSGASISAYYDNVLIASTSNTFQQSSQAHGLQSFNSSANRFDNFSVTA